MEVARVLAYTIGQTPRPDLLEAVANRFPFLDVELRGALDGVVAAEIPPCPPGGYPLETRLEDGTRVVVDAGFVEGRIRELLRARDAGAGRQGRVAHLVLCAGPFPDLAVAGPERTGAEAPALILPFEVGVEVLRRQELTHIDVAVPFAGQAGPAALKWQGRGFRCTAHLLGGEEARGDLRFWLEERVGPSDAQALVFDYVGLPEALAEQAGDVLDRPVFDLGRLALDALEAALGGRHGGFG